MPIRSAAWARSSFLGGVQQFVGGGREAFRASPRSHDHRTQRLLHCLHARKQAGRVAWCAPDIGGQVAGGNLLGDLGGVCGSPPGVF